MTGRDYRRTVTVGLLVLFLSLPVVISAETVLQEPFTAVSPEIMGQGGSFAAVAEGYHALFTNPAGIANGDGPELTLPSISFWAHSRPDLLLSTVAAFSGEQSDVTTGEELSQEDLILDVLTEQFTTNGFGVGTAFGIGYTGERIGFGLNLALDSYLFGNAFPLGLEGSIDSQLTLVVGYAQPIAIGPVTVIPGIDLRPTMRIVSLVDSTAAADLLTQFMGVDTGEEDTGADESITAQIDAFNGWGIAFDAGLIAKYETFSVALQIRDLFGTKMQYSNNSLEEILDSLSQGGLPELPTDPADTDHYVADQYVIASKTSIGAAWQPDLGPIGFLVDPELHIEFSDIFGASTASETSRDSFWTKVHVGTEVSLLRFFDFRAGINQGYVTMGAGLDLAMMELNFAVFSQEFGRYPGDRQVGGAALEVAFRF